MTIKFVPGQSYAARSSADYDTIFAFEIIRRTDKCVWIKVRGEEVRRTIRVIDGVEAIDPQGRYSMSPVLYADKTEHAVVSGKKLTAEEAAALATPRAPKLRAYQQEMLDYVAHRHELVEQRPTAPVVDALKASSALVAEAVTEETKVRTFDKATAIMSRFLFASGKPVSRENVRFMLDVICMMNDQDFDDLDLIRQWLRGE